MTPSQIDALVQHYLNTTLELFENDRLEQGRTTDDESEGRWLVLSNLIDGTVEQLTNCDYRTVKPVLEGLLKEHGLTLPETAPAYKRLCRALLSAQQRAFTIEMERMSGDYRTQVPGTSQGASSPSTQSNSTLAQTLATGLTLAKAIPLYMEHYKHRESRTNTEKVANLRRLIETLPDGDATPIKDVTKAQCVAFRDTIARLPKRIPNNLRGKIVSEIVAALNGKGKGRKPYVQLTHSTVNGALTDLRHFFTWAMRHDHYPGRNPVEGIDFEGVEDQHYDPYSDSDIRTLFTHPRFTGAAAYPEHTARYWLPLILLYTGARREEIAGLTLADIRPDEHGVWFIDIRSDAATGRRVKNTTSERRVPIHTHLIELGLLELVTKKKRTGRPGADRLLFARPSGKGGRATVGDAVSKWWARFLKHCKVEGHKNMHSFRHTVVTKLTAVGVPQDMREMLVGHASNSVHGQVYVHRDKMPLTILKEHLEKLDFRPMLRGSPEMPIVR